MPLTLHDINPKAHATCDPALVLIIAAMHVTTA